MQKGLGRGLDALFGGVVKPEEEIAPLKLPLSEVEPNPEQPRKAFRDDKLEELAQSIKEQGILQPILVRPGKDGKYQIIAGERRWRAAQLAGLSIVPVIVRELKDSEATAVALIENLQREDLNPIEEACALASLKETLNLSQEELAVKLGKSRSAVANAVRLLQLSPSAREDVVRGALSAGHARCLVSIDDPAKAEILRKKIIETEMTVRQCENAVSAYKEKGCFDWEKVRAEKKGQTAEKRERSASGWKDMEKNISEKIGLTVKINGSREKGKISFHFATREELRAILLNMGISLDEIT